MLNEKNIVALKSRLLSLGFPDGLERGLRAHICLQLEAFTLQYRRHREGDVVSVSLHFQREADTPDYQCRYYDACLRKRVDIPALLLQGVDTEDLVQRMQAVDWQVPLPVAYLEDTAGALAPSSWHREEAIEGIMTDLRRLEGSTEGAALALQLKWKFWAGTPLEGFMAGVSAVRSSGEVSQRFYFFDGEEGITLEEACRFLAHRWREKKWQEQKKQSRPSSPARSPERPDSIGPGKKRPPKEKKQKE